MVPYHPGLSLFKPPPLDIIKSGIDTLGAFFGNRAGKTRPGTGIKWERPFRRRVYREAHGFRPDLIPLGRGIKQDVFGWVF